MRARRVFLLVFIVLLFFVGYLPWVRPPLLYTASPILKMGQFIKKQIQTFPKFGEISFLISSNQRLTQENIHLETELAVLKEITKENEVLRKELHFVRSSGLLSLKYATVIGVDPYPFLRSLIIDKGSSSGFVIGQAVVSNGSFIGVISEIFNSFARVKLITDQNSSIPVKIAGTNYDGIIKGNPGLGLIVNDLPARADIKKGDLVITSALGGILIPGILVGKVVEFSAEQNSLTSSAIVNPIIDISEIRIVGVVQ